MAMDTMTAHAGDHATVRGPAAGGTISEGGEQWLPAIPGETVRIRVPATSAGGRLSVVESHALPLTATPLHIHTEDELFHVLEGVLTFSVGGRRFDAGPGALVTAPRGVPHAWANFGNEPARTMVMFTPGGIETLFAQLADLSPAEVVALAERYGLAVVGPPIER